MQKQKPSALSQNDALLLPFKGKHAPLDKIFLLFPVTVIICLLPSCIGIRLWDKIPEVVTTGIVNARGEDDSMPRAILVYGLPVLVCLINIICHVQLFLHQRWKTLPPGFVSLVGRLGMPCVSVFAIASFILLGAGISPGGAHLAICAAGMLLVACGSQILDFTGGGIPGLVDESLPELKLYLFAGKDHYFWIGTAFLLLGLFILAADMVFGRENVLLSVLPALAGVITVILIFRSRRGTK